MQLREGILISTLVLAPSLVAMAGTSSTGADTAGDTASTMVLPRIDAPQVLAAPAPDANVAPAGVEVHRTAALDTGGLDLRYAGTVETDGGTGHALALVFTGEFRPGGRFSEYIFVIGRDGRHVAGRWRVAEEDPRVLFFPVADSGDYRVILTPGLSDGDNDVLRTRYHGTVEVIR